MAAETKRCRKCGSVLSLEEFHRYRASPDGRQSACKVCHRAAVAASTARHRDANYRRNRRWIKQNAEKRVAHLAVYRAVASGRLVRPEACDDCGAGGSIHAHHDNYSRQLDVRWLCPLCHAAAHEPRRVT